MKAAILYAAKSPLKVEEVELEPPHEDEIRVRIVAVGLCHTDLHPIEGDFPVPLPIVLGHEGAGIVVELGARVTDLKLGDHVVLTAATSCGRCQYCLIGVPALCEVFRPLHLQGTLLGGQKRLIKGDQRLNHFFEQSSFAEEVVVHERTAVKVRNDAALEKVSLFGCGVTTGISSVLNAAHVRAGTSVAVFGCGGVGLGVIMAASLAGARKIIGVDVLDSRLKCARDMGATDVIDASMGDPVQRIQRLTGGGVDYSFEAIGNPAVMTQAFDCIRPLGNCIVLGATPAGVKVSLDTRSLLGGKCIMGCVQGWVRPHFDIPRYVDLYMEGKLPLDRLITKTFALDEINTAVEAAKKGEVARAVILP